MGEKVSAPLEPLRLPRVAMLTLARGGSVRLPRKNLRPFCGRPLCAWTILQARCSRLISDIYMVTDSPEIGEICAAEGANVLYQPTSDCQHGVNGGTYATVHGLKQLAAIGRRPDYLLSMFTTSPLRRPEDTDECIRSHLEGVMGRTISVVRMADLMVLFDKGRLTARQGVATMDALIKPDAVGRSPLLHNGAYSIARTDFYEYFTNYQIGNNAPLGPVLDTGYYEMPFWTLQDIDTEEDWEICEHWFTEKILKPLGEDCYERYSQRVGKAAVGESL